jgi:hypothetical protein
VIGPNVEDLPFLLVHGAVIAKLLVVGSALPITALATVVLVGEGLGYWVFGQVGKAGLEHWSDVDGPRSETLESLGPLVRAAAVARRQAILDRHAAAFADRDRLIWLLASRM